MKITKLLWTLGFMPLLLYCSNNASNSSSNDNVLEDKSFKPDTTINSIPLNFSFVLDTLDESHKYTIQSYKEILDLYEKLNYTPEAWQAGIREIPRVYLTTIGDRWGSKTTREITVLLKKQLFFRGLAPLILRSNELILEDRDRLGRIINIVRDGHSLSDFDLRWTNKLAKAYKVGDDSEKVNMPLLDELWKRVDIVPPSLALSQGAEESGWGTSRFAATGNAIYGQWTWGSNAIIPEKQRKELGNYGIAAFESLFESVCGYMLNLNTHNAYAELRNKRAELRKNGKQITGLVLAEQLTRYSERGEDYVRDLKSLMEYNRLEPVDDAYLGNDPPIFLIPATE